MFFQRDTLAVTKQEHQGRDLMSRKVAVSLGELELTDHELIVTTKGIGSALGSTVKGLAKFVGSFSGAGISEGSTRSLRLEQIDSIEINWLAVGSGLVTGLSKMTGSTLEPPIGNLQIVTSSGGPNGTVILGIPKENKDAIVTFVEEIKVAAQKARDRAVSGVTGETKVCPECAEEVKQAATKCRFCSHKFD
jgi:hypothetical protein